MTATAKRRKYQYPTRQAAEDATRDLRIQSDRNSTVMNALIADTVQWLPARYGSASSYYRFGVVPRLAEQIIVVVFYCPATGQKPHAAAWGEDRLELEIRSFALTPPGNDESRAYRNGLHAVRVLANDTRP